MNDPKEIIDFQRADDDWMNRLHDEVVDYEQETEET